jgi:hypothetical protein
VRGHAGHPAKDVERRAFGGEQHAGGARHRRQHVAAGNPRAVAGLRDELDGTRHRIVRADPAVGGQLGRDIEHRLGHRQPRDNSVRASHDVGGVELAGRNRRHAGDVEGRGSEILGQRRRGDPLDVRGLEPGPPQRVRGGLLHVARSHSCSSRPLTPIAPST